MKNLNVHTLVLILINLSKKQLVNKIEKHTSNLQGIIISIAKPFPNKLIQNTEDYIFEEQINIQPY